MSMVQTFCEKIMPNANKTIDKALIKMANKYLVSTDHDMLEMSTEKFLRDCLLRHGKKNRICLTAYETLFSSGGFSAPRLPVLNNSAFKKVLQEHRAMMKKRYKLKNSTLKKVLQEYRAMLKKRYEEEFVDGEKFNRKEDQL